MGAHATLVNTCSRTGDILCIGVLDLLGEIIPHLTKRIKRGETLNISDYVAENDSPRIKLWVEARKNVDDEFRGEIKDVSVCDR